ncbi:FecR domain-containing protein [uncultured Sunxiuqinia sp.]|uniref:FecR family protein n=1 Tax=uncultured Sunxiuqinia sp. TaxID=1573825 RepID=UPI002AA8AF37|nr:FecR domain-containing protein [uncultured Sunxiuqinia sp.]
MVKQNQDIIDNPLFFRWIFNSDELVDTYWAKYMIESPDDVEFIQETKLNLLKLNHSNEILSSVEKKTLSSNIIHLLEREDRKLRSRRFIKELSKYVAVAILFSMISGIAVYYQMDKDTQNTFDQFVYTPVQVNEPTLILSENDKIGLEESESTLSYSERGDILLNENKVIKSAQSNSQRINQLVIPYGNRSKIILSDGTTVWLNAGSRLIYPEVFGVKNREVTLYGEAFFDVSHNETKPFIVKTTDLNIRVLGTRFNVNAYPDDYTIQTTLEEGSISVKKREAGLFERELVLKPNQQYVFNRQTEASKVNRVDAQSYLIWTEGLLRFNDEQFSRIVRKVERYYNVLVSIDSPVLAREKITGKLDLSQGIDETLEYLSRVSQTNYKKENESNYLISNKK